MSKVPYIVLLGMLVFFLSHLRVLATPYSWLPTVGFLAAICCCVVGVGIFWKG